MTPAQQARQRGFEANLATRGICVRCDTGEKLKIIRKDVSTISDPEQSARQEKPVYCDIVSLSGGVLNPRNIASFTEVIDSVTDGRVFSVIHFDDKAADAVTWTWNCESSRL